MSAFKCYVLPVLEYCSFVWSPSSTCDIKLVENVLLLGVYVKDVIYLKYVIVKYCHFYMYIVLNIYAYFLR